MTQAWVCRDCGRNWSLSPNANQPNCICGGRLVARTIDARRKRTKPIAYGVGSILRRMLGCGCKSIPFEQWNEAGRDWCRDHREEIAQRIADTPKARTGYRAALVFVDDAIIESSKYLDRVALVTVHFNPLRYRRLRDTYYEWLPTLGPIAERLTCYELVFDDDDPEIDGAVVIRGTRAKNLMWQKEAMVNYALRQQPPHIRYFGWVDHDLIFTNPHWLEEAVAKIDAGAAAVQCFGRVSFRGASGEHLRHSPGAVSQSINHGRRNGSPGGVWLADRRLLEEIGGLVENNIVGGGDQALYSAAIGDSGDYYLRRHINPFRANNAAWIDNASRAFAGRTVDYVQGTVRHLWHGDRKHRRYLERDTILRRHRFDPDHDIQRGPLGILEWATHKPDLHRDVREYFEERREDEG